MLPGDKISDAMCDMITVVNICEDLRKKYLEVKAAGDEKLAKEYSTDEATKENEAAK